MEGYYYKSPKLYMSDIIAISKLNIYSINYGAKSEIKNQIAVSKNEEKR